MAETTPPVAIIMGSQSDWATMRKAAQALDALGVGYEARIVSAHRTPNRLYAFAQGAADRGVKVIIAGAGGCRASARHDGFHDPILPVLGVPVRVARRWLGSR